MVAPQALTIVCDGTAQQLSAMTRAAKWVLATTGGDNQAAINFGNSTVTAPAVSPVAAGVGYPLNPGFSGVFLPPIAELYSFYPLDEMYIAGVIGDILYLLIGG